jgi:hypothetical protein
MRGIIVLAIAAFAPALACGQSFSFGLKAGVPITEYFQTGHYAYAVGPSEYTYGDYSQATRRYTFGVSAEWHPWQSLGFEVDALYKRMGYVSFEYSFNDGPIYIYALDVKGNSWEFPVLAKYRFRRGLHPYVASGGAFRYIGPVRGRGSNVFDGHLLPGGAITVTPIDTRNPPELDTRFFPGIVGAGGIELRVGRFRLLPEVRYTRWMTNLPDYALPLSLKSNQVEFLVGWLF